MKSIWLLAAKSRAYSKHQSFWHEATQSPVWWPLSVIRAPLMTAEIMVHLVYDILGYPSPSQQAYSIHVYVHIYKHPYIHTCTQTYIIHAYIYTYMQLLQTIIILVLATNILMYHKGILTRRICEYLSKMRPRRLRLASSIDGSSYQIEIAVNNSKFQSFNSMTVISPQIHT